MGLEQVHHEANWKALKAPSPSPHPVPTVGVERIVTGPWNSLGGAGGCSHKGYKYKQPSCELLGWEQLTVCSLPFKGQNKEAPWSISTKEVPLLLRNASSTNTCINNSPQNKLQMPGKGTRRPETRQRLVPAKTKHPGPGLKKGWLRGSCGYHTHIIRSSKGCLLHKYFT